MNNKTGNRKYLKSLKKLEGEYNYESKIITSSDIIELNKNIRLCLKHRFDIIESKLFITNEEYSKFINQDTIDTVLLDKETKYLEEEGILSWVRESKVNQIVPSPFHSYGKSSIFITPILFADEFIGYYISLSKSSRLEFNDKKASSYNDIIIKYCVKLELFVKNKELEFHKNQNVILSDKLNELPELINCKTVIKSTAENIIESVSILKSNLNLLDSDSDMYFTRLKKITSEVDDIYNLSSSLQAKLIASNSETNIDTITNDILNLLHHKINEVEIDVHTSKLENLTLNKNQDVLYNAVLSIIDYLVSSNLAFNCLNIVGKSKFNSKQISFYLGLEHYTINNISSPEKLTEQAIPDKLVITDNSLNHIGAKLSIKYSPEFGYFIKVIF